MRIKLLQVLTAVAFFPSCFSWAQAKVDFSQISFSINDNSEAVKDRSVRLENGVAQDVVLVRTQDGKAQLSITMKISRMKSKISQHKTQGVRLALKYQCTFEGVVSKNRTERVFWPDNDGNFEERVTFSFNQDKLKPLVATLRYQAKVNLN